MELHTSTQSTLTEGTDNDSFKKYQGIYIVY